jgi:hypothetical protein
MINLNDGNCELEIDELDAVSGGKISDLVHWSQVAGALVAVWSRPPVEVSTGCGN